LEEGILEPAIGFEPMTF